LKVRTNWKENVKSHTKPLRDVTRESDITDVIRQFGRLDVTCDPIEITSDIDYFSNVAKARFELRDSRYYTDSIGQGDAREGPR